MCFQFKICSPLKMLSYIVLSTLISFISAKYPSDLTRCHFGEVECLKTVIGTYATALREGRRDVNLVPIDPLQVNEVNIVQGSTSPVNINLKFRELKCYGLSSATITNVVGFEKDPTTSKFELYARIKQISLVGNYKARGNILVLPIFGHGGANMTFDNVDASIKFLPKVEIKKGKQYLRISDLVLDFNTTRLWMDFENLFNGDEALSESTNQFLNENWMDILHELKPVLTKAIGGIYKGVAEPIFNKFPYADLFLRDDE